MGNATSQTRCCGPVERRVKEASAGYSNVRVAQSIHPELLSRGEVGAQCQCGKVSGMLSSQSVVKVSQRRQAGGWWLERTGLPRWRVPHDSLG